MFFSAQKHSDTIIFCSYIFSSKCFLWLPWSQLEPQRCAGEGRPSSTGFYWQKAEHVQESECLRLSPTSTAGFVRFLVATIHAAAAATLYLKEKCNTLLCPDILTKQYTYKGLKCNH